MTKATILLCALCACSSSQPNNDAGADASSPNDAAQEAAVVTCTTPGAACPSGGKCFFTVGDCTATTGICADDSYCASAKTETMCGCDGTMSSVPQCGPGNYALVKAANFGPCTSDGGADASDAGGD